MRSGPRTLVTAVLGGLAVACAGAVSPLSVTGEAEGSANFQLGRPVAYAAATGSRILGTACRRGTTTLMPPQHVRIEHLSAAGEILHTARAYLPAMSGRAAQRCSHYVVQVDWKPVEGESLRACFDHGQACPGPK